MSTSVSRLAADTGLTVEQVLEICRRAGVSAWGPTTILLEGDLRTLQPHLSAAAPRPDAFGAPQAPTPPVAPPSQALPPPGQPLPPPAAPLPPPGSTFGAPPPPGPSGSGPSFGAPPPGPPFGAPMPPPGYVPPGYAVPGTPPRSGGSRARTALIAMGIVVAGIVGLAIIGAIAGDPDDGTDSVLDRLPEVFGPELPDFSVGDCFDDNSDVPISTGTSLVEARVEQVPCTGTHDAEVFFVFDHPAPDDATYPGDGPMFDTAIDGCMAQFEAFVGAPYETSALDVYFLAPSSQGFNRLDERKITCAVVNLDQTPLPGGTQRGSGR